MSADLALSGSVLPAGAEQWSRENFVTAWRDADNRVTWAKAALAAAFEARYGELPWLARQVGVARSTLLSYRAVWAAYADCSDVRTIAFGVAEALMAQPDRLELVSREQPWTVAEARELAASRREPEPLASRSRPERKRKDAQRRPALAPDPGPQPGSAGPVPAAVDDTQLAVLDSAVVALAGIAASIGGIAELGPDIDDGSAELLAGEIGSQLPVIGRVRDLLAERAGMPAAEPCPRCTHLEAELADRSAALETAHRRIAHLEQQAADRDRLAGLVRELDSRIEELEYAGRSAAPDGDERPYSAGRLQPPPQGAGSAHGSPQVLPGAPARRRCDSPHAVRMLIEMPNGSRGERWLCPEHVDALAALGAAVSPAGSDDLLSWDVERCQFQVPAAMVTA